ncbi:MAG: hypothetical protein V3T14_07280, partial [Myxococcota bacterium]
ADQHRDEQDEVVDILRVSRKSRDVAFDHARSLQHIQEDGGHPQHRTDHRDEKGPARDVFSGKVLCHDYRERVLM